MLNEAEQDLELDFHQYPPVCLQGQASAAQAKCTHESQLVLTTFMLQLRVENYEIWYSNLCLALKERLGGNAKQPQL